MRHPFDRPYAITMWDFSWLERRWPGAGYEDWDQALSELAERGYDAVRIDAYPHLVSADPERKWELPPAWNQTSWGAQSLIHVTILPELLEFIRAAKRHNIVVALSTWYREDRDNTRMNIRTAQDQAQIWIDTLRHIDQAGLLDTILYVDLCNEFPADVWAPYLFEAIRNPETGEAYKEMISRADPRVGAWMRDSIEAVRREYPDLDYTYSFSDEFDNWKDQDVETFDVLEPHIWMSHPETGDFHKRVGYNFERFDPIGFDNVVANARREYESNKAHWDAALFREIDQIADWSRATHKGLYITECWALVDYKDWPGLEWDWIKDLTAKGLEYAASKGRWVGMATSNFCGPQFVGMWRDIEWHQRLTQIIKSAPIDEDIRLHRRAEVTASRTSPS
ncbi:cellulase-like family protein [Pseudarthrobacter raffinosi]|uniref:cellulase-like family protein n=1 Tax=Pseudarthrobacter raffinosi TaxID=2953651 RepID=UPI00208EAD4E|nr:cellulase-like family protein [Pseudarthrobacter sp. MDT3-9]MCO4253267.1 hypothetical protein [Pseudarthrobacter sp. MDT3-9]